ncbi:hypothetical protein I4F81_004861 [Pyropia yezoensis]|uniref:Uncharacterized protein n=1 Tax=Pyropia yezoensis TaxID=2788 RepID=A0ACC3BXM4_PYRYE|nr:hypothetical protein I4F81_004861 [Neopyropia yezoensis]
MAAEEAAAAADAGLTDGVSCGSDGDAGVPYIHPSRLSPPPPDPPAAAPTAATVDAAAAVTLSALPGGPARLSPDGVAALRRLAAAGRRHAALAGLAGLTAARPGRPLHTVTPAAAGGTLAAGLAALHTPARHGALAAPVAADIGRRLAGAVAALHAAGLVHGRLTPAAVGLSVPLREWVVGTSGVVLGGVVPPEALASTPGAAFDDLLLPPAATDEPPLVTRGRRVDAYAVGVMLWELFAGAPPYAGLSAAAIAGHVLGGGRPGPPPRRGGGAVAAAVEGAWAALPEERLGWEGGEALPPPPMSVNRVKGWGARRRV